MEQDKKSKNFIKTTIREFLNENVENNQQRIWKNTFEYKGNSYRLSSWKYIYQFSDGSIEFATVNKEDANGVSGSGVAGVVAKLEDVKWLDRTTLFDDEFIKQKEASNKQRILDDKDRYELLKSLPKNISREEYDEIIINRALGF